MATLGSTRRRFLAGGLAASASLVGTQRAWSQAGPIRLGVLQTLSGPLASIGSAHVVGARIAARMVNDAGGVDGRPIELVIRDTRGSSTDMIGAMRELTGTGINLLIGEALSGQNIAALPIVPSLGAVYVFSTSIAMDFNHELYNRNSFHAYANAHMQFMSEAKLISERYPDLKRWGCYAADVAGLRVSQEYLYAGLKKFYAAKGTQIELMEPVLAKAGAIDYRNQTATLLSQNLQGIVLADSGGNLLSFLKQAMPFKLFSSIGAIADLTYYPGLGATLRKDTPKNWWTNCSWTYDRFKDLPMAQVFYKLAVEETKQSFLDPYLAQAHLAVTTMVNGLRNAHGTGTDEVIAAIERMKYDTVYGPLNFRAEDHQLCMDVNFVRLGPDESEAGWSVQESVLVPWTETIEPASPGRKFVLG